jgi:hypothetical protein
MVLPDIFFQQLGSALGRLLFDMLFGKGWEKRGHEWLKKQAKRRLW